MKRLTLALILSLLMKLVFALLAPGAGALNYEFTHISSQINSIKLYSVAQDRLVNTALFTLQTPDTLTFQTYCCDFETFSSEGTKYARVNLEDGGYYDDINADKIQAIVQAAYPYATIEEMREAALLWGLAPEYAAFTPEEAIAATQAAIWQCSNAVAGEVVADPSLPQEQQDRINAVRDWLFSLTSQEPAVALFAIHGASILDPNSGQFKLRVVYGNAGRNQDGSLIPLAATLDPGATFDSTPINNGDGSYTAFITADPGVTNITMHVTGEQVTGYNACFYTPEGGRDEAQSFVGIGAPTTDQAADFSFDQADFSRCIVIEKVDQASPEIKPDGAEFALYERVRVGQGEARDLFLGRYRTTGAQGSAQICGLNPDSFYTVVEVTAPEGYISDGTTHLIEPSESPDVLVLTIANRKKEVPPEPTPLEPLPYTGEYIGGEP